MFALRHPGGKFMRPTHVMGTTALLVILVSAPTFAAGQKGHGNAGAGKTTAGKAHVTKPAGGKASTAGAQAAKGPKTHGPKTTSGSSASAKSTGPKSKTTTSTTTASTTGATTTSAPTTSNAAVWTPTTPVAQKLSTKPNLMAKVKASLPPGTDLNAATAGFKNFGQFIAATNVSTNLGIDFSKLKASMTGTDLAGVATGQPTRSLGQSIQQLKPGADGTTEAARAERLAEQQIASSGQ